MSAITTHVLDTSRGRPASGVRVTLDRRVGPGQWERLGAGDTDADGRLGTLLPDGRPPAPGVYRLTFEIGRYFGASSRACFYPEASVVFEATGDAHYHVPLLVSPFGYSTYRGS